MLGRYVGATLVILGVAMLMAPEDAPERDTPPEARAEAPRPAAPRPAPPAAESLATVSLASEREAGAPAPARSGGEPAVRALTPDATPAAALTSDMATQPDSATQQDSATVQDGAVTALFRAPPAEDAEMAVPTLEDPASLQEASLTSQGSAGFAKGGEFNRKHGNRLMRWRLGAQAVAVALIVLFVYARAGVGRLTWSS
jgi:hypothetical protein